MSAADVFDKPDSWVETPQPIFVSILLLPHKQQCNIVTNDSCNTMVVPFGATCMSPCSMNSGVTYEWTEPLWLLILSMHLKVIYWHVLHHNSNTGSFSSHLHKSIIYRQCSVTAYSTWVRSSSLKIGRGGPRNAAETTEPYWHSKKA